MMKIYPALDLLDGSVVRLQKGVFSQVTNFGDPFSWLERFDAAGIEGIHVVDLSGAQNRSERQCNLIETIVERYPGRIQIGGGIREEEQALRLFNAGARRVIFGTSAMEQPSVVISAINRWGAERVALALDVTRSADGYDVATNAWRQSASKSLDNALSFWSDRGIRYVMCTDISRDGMMVGPNLPLYQSLRSRFPHISIIASGGVSNNDDLQRLRELGLHGVIVGKAILSGAITLGEVSGNAGKKNYPLS
jgi:phosphoribosylformimino-5-aminoimidazole carboxamide ribotide isomerase